MTRAISIAVAVIAMVFSSCAAWATAITTITQGVHPRVAADHAGNLSVVFEGFYKGSDIRDILYCGSHDGGRTWAPPVNVSRTPGVSTTPAIAIENSGAIDVVWRDTSSGELSPDIYFNRSNDGGKTWGTALDISNTPGVCTDPAIAVGADGSIHAVWIDTSLYNGRPDVFYSCSTDSGKTWSHYEDISPTPGISTEPFIVVASDRVIHSGWVDTTSGEEHPDIYYVRKVPDSPWTKPVDISNSPRMSHHPSISCGQQGKVYLCWSDNSQKENAADIWCVIGRNGKFAKPINISDTPGVSSQPSLAAGEAGRVGIVWSDTSLKRTRPDIYARVSTDSGSDFSNVLTDISDMEDSAIRPSATFVGTKMIVVWEAVRGSLSTLKMTSVELKNIGTGPVDQVNPTVHRVNR
jgi:hypothetical protein